MQKFQIYHYNRKANLNLKCEMFNEAFFLEP